MTPNVNLVDISRQFDLIGVTLLTPNDAFRLYLRVRYAECDAQGVVFNARYGDYVDLAATEFYRAIVGGYDHMIQQGVDTQVVSLKTDWTAPAHFDEVLCCDVRLERIGNTSFTLSVDFTELEEQRPVAKASIVYVTVTPTEHQKLAVPEFLRAALQDAAKGKSFDLAGVTVK